MRRFVRYGKYFLAAIVGVGVVIATVTLLVDPVPTVVHKGSSTLVKGQVPMGFHSMGKRALCMSGGGYRAALFDVGALWRLNELGALQHIDFVSSVSGGSIVAAYLVLHWNELHFDPKTGVATNFPDLIAKPIVDLTRSTLVVRPFIVGLLGARSVGAEMADAYDHRLFRKATLADLPDFSSSTATAPRLVINASRLEDGGLWTFGQDGITAASWPTDAQNSQSGDDRSLPIAVAVAASAAFPPFLGPITLDMHELLPSAAELTQRYGSIHSTYGAAETDTSLSAD